ncbi:MAG TPA: ABC transporter permease [Gammaproteobacteria bacterium]|nr:ABC transporter permease [Gammaproteobacteria bacterium]
MAAGVERHNGPQRLIEGVGRRFVAGVEEFGYGGTLLVESLFWLLLGRWFRQPVRLPAVAEEMMSIGVRAIPVLVILAFANGAMMAMQGIYTLRDFGAESHVVPGIAMSVVREFGVLIAGIVVAGRSGSAIAARIGTMQMAQEVDALRVMGISPVRYLVAPVLAAMLLMMPALTVLANCLAIVGGGVFSVMELHIGWVTYFDRVLAVLSSDDIAQGMIKSLVFGVLITLVATANGFSASGGAEGLGRATTRSVVLCISAIVVADMIFTFFLSR